MSAINTHPTLQLKLLHAQRLLQESPKTLILVLRARMRPVREG